jgi:hypothetical protein
MGAPTGRAIARLALAFGLVALALAAIGLYGVLSYGVARRTSEIAVRIALGARPSRVIAMILGETAGVVALGVVAGGALAFAGSPVSLPAPCSASTRGIRRPLRRQSRCFWQLRGSPPICRRGARRRSSLLRRSAPISRNPDHSGHCPAAAHASWGAGTSRFMYVSA